MNESCVGSSAMSRRCCGAVSDNSKTDALFICRADEMYGRYCDQQRKESGGIYLVKNTIQKILDEAE